MNMGSVDDAVPDVDVATANRGDEALAAITESVAHGVEVLMPRMLPFV